MIIAQAGRVMMAGELEENISETLSVIDCLRNIINEEDNEELRDSLMKEVSEDMVDIFFLGLTEVADRMRQKRGDADGSEDDNAEGQE